MIHPAAVGLAAGLLALCGQAVATAQETARDVGCLGHEHLIEALDEKAVRTPDGSWQIVRAVRFESADPGTASADPGFPVLYLAGRPRTDLTRRIVTGKITVLLVAKTDPIRIARDYGLRHAGLCADAPPYRIFQAASPADAIALRENLQNDPRIASFEIMLARQMARRSLPNDPLVPQQWHLRQTASPATGPVDLNVESVWGTFGGTGRRGRNVRIGIVDDGIQLNHPDLVDRLDLNADRNWNGGNFDDGGAQNADDSHGTAVAGLAAAEGNNGIGVAGVAPDATLVSLRLIADAHDDQAEAACFNFLANGTAGTGIPIKNCSWGPQDGEFQLASPGALARQALINTTTTGRGGRGTVWVWAVGNGGDTGEDANLDGYANDIHVIAVGSVDSAGRAADSSEPGACLALCAPSNSASRPGLVTTDRTGAAGFNPPANAGLTDLSDRDYTKHFGRTSAAAPLVAGVCALMLEARPTLGWRDVKEILMCTARRIDAADPGWMVNGAGLHFNDRYGAGLVDASAAVAMAQAWTNLGPLRQQESVNSQPGAIPDGSPSGLVRTFTVAGRRRVEHATLKLNVTHPYRGDLKVTLTSPAGTVSTLARSNSFFSAEQKNFQAWTFSTLQMWGEPTTGTWTLRIVDEFSDGTGSFSNATLTLWGAEFAAPPYFTSADSIRCVVGESLSHTVTTAHGPNPLSVQGLLPPGLNFDPTTGVLKGTCTLAGEFVIAIRATNQTGSTTQNLKLKVLSRYEQWTLDHQLGPGDEDPDDDPDDDGVPNVLEYASCGVPGKSSPPPQARLERASDGDLSFSFTRWPLRTDAAWLLEFSTDCDDWDPIARSLGGDPVEPMALMPAGRFIVTETPHPEDGSVAVRVTDTAPPSRSGWFRLRAQLVP